ncbi:MULTISPECIES: hypothetical protein [unclassified Dysgonomonas]|uniref:hypothetical protein n=1 Tax=unclassified Dysgonomonas TaxID=2630389 RepID=UPI0025C5DC63|nr:MULTISPECIES: hypothetical protein [unclassified Dysgonomonas]HMM02009.1 hypothetical protein [Dysgonomonas sp.]
MKNLKKELEERLTSIEAAYNEAGRPKVDFTVYPENMRVHEEGDYNAKVIVEAARKIERECGLGEIDWADPSQRKWAPWFWMRPSGFAFESSGYVFTRAGAGSGSRLRVLTEIAADHIGKTFLEVWEAVQLK